MSLIDSTQYLTISLLAKSQNPVLKVLDYASKKNYALKKINRTNYSHHLTDFQELMILSSLNHPHILRPKGYQCRYQKINNIMNYELILLMDLMYSDLNKDIVKKSQNKQFYSFELLIDIATQLIETVQFMHKKGVAHRDIKPENILLKDDSKNYFIMLCDFSDSYKKNTIKPIAKTLVGSPYYMAPELKKAYIDGDDLDSFNHDPFKSDIYAIGMTLVDLSIMSIGEKKPLKDKLIEIEKKYGKFFCQIIEKCLDNNWKNRINAEDLYKLIQNINLDNSKNYEDENIEIAQENIFTNQIFNIFKKMDSHIDKKMKDKFKKIIQRLDSIENENRLIEESLRHQKSENIKRETLKKESVKKEKRSMIYTISNLLCTLFVPN